LPGKANCCCPARMQHSVLCPRFRGEDGSEDLPVRFGGRWRKLLRRRDRQRRLRTDLRLFGFNVWFASLEWGREREPFGDCVHPWTMAAAAEVAGESPGACRPAGSPVWRLFIPAGAEPEFRL
jgi:hypothetical protein